jgi:hypothetical protein
MLGRRNPQRSLFSVQHLPHAVNPDTFYGRMGALSGVLFRDEDLQGMYCPDNGRPSLPPSLMAGVLLLQFHDDVSDAEAVERSLFDLRWKVGLDLPLDYEGFDPSSLSVFRRRLVEYGQERYAFDRFIRVSREAGLIPDKVSLLLDTTWAKGAGAVQDTYTLLRKGIRKLLKSMGYHLPGRRSGLSEAARAVVASYLEQDRKADIDWADPAARTAQLKVLVQDAEMTLEWASEQIADPEVRSIGWLLTKILGDDIDLDTQGQPKLAEGTAPERIISLSEPQMHHGRKSASHRFDGFKVAVAEEPTTELLLDIADMPAPGSDGTELLPSMARVERYAGVTVDQVLADGAFGSGDNRAACATYAPHPIDLVSPLAQPADPAVAKSAFQINLEQATATCPHGQTVSGQPRHDEQGRSILEFSFARSTCETCPLFSRCVRSKTKGRTLRTHAHEAYLQAARQRQQTQAFKELYRTRSKVEPKQAELVRHGLRQTRYLGQPKRQLQRLWTGAAVNLKRLFKLAQTRQINLEAVLAGLDPRPTGSVLTG